MTTQHELDFDDVPTNITECPPSGVYEDVSFDTYATWRAVNSGVIKWGKISPKHFHAAMNGELKSEDTRSMKLGRAIHCMLLEPDTFSDRFVVAGSCSATLKSGDRKGELCGRQSTYMDPTGDWYCGTHEPKDKAPHGMEVITETEMRQAEGVRESLKSSPVMGMLRRPGWSECSIVWEYGGLPIKGRLDRACLEGSRPTIMDLKKCQPGKATQEEMERAILNHGYHIQAAGYVRGIEALTGKTPEFWWIFVEDKPPYDVNVQLASAQVIGIGWQAFKGAIDSYNYAVKNGQIHGYVGPYREFYPGGLPAFYIRQQLAAEQSIE